MCQDPDRKFYRTHSVEIRRIKNQTTNNGVVTWIVLCHGFTTSEGNVAMPQAITMPEASYSITTFSHLDAPMTIGMVFNHESHCAFHRYSTAGG